MLRYGEIKQQKKKFNVNNVVDNISKLNETKNNSTYFIGYSVDVIRPLVLILPKVRRYVKTFTDKGRDKIIN